MYTRPSERVQHPSRTTGAPAPAPGDKDGLPAAKSPSGRPKDNWPLIKTLFYYSPEEIAAIRDFERREREWKQFIADSGDEDSDSDDEGAYTRAAYAAAREDLREGTEATQPLGERGGLDWSDEDEEEEVDLVGEAQARFRHWDENASKTADEEGEQNSQTTHPSGNATPQAHEAPSNAITNDFAVDPSANATPQAHGDQSSTTAHDSAAQNAVDHSAIATPQAQEGPSNTVATDPSALDAVDPSSNATPQAQEDLLGATVDNINAGDAVDPSANATPQAQEDPSSATAINTAAGDVVNPNTVGPANEQEVPTGTIVPDLTNGDTAPPQMPPTPRLEGIDHVPRAEKRRSQSPPEREGSSGRVKLMETIAEGEEQGNGTDAEGKEIEER